MFLRFFRMYCLMITRSISFMVMGSIHTHKVKQDIYEQSLIELQLTLLKASCASVIHTYMHSFDH